MDLTPKLQRKPTLSLSTRLNQKRHSASPHNRAKTSTTNGAINSSELNSHCIAVERLQRSPSVTSICSDGGIECTPPHKKMALNLDESIEYSPKIFDSSFSPSCLLSQTLAIDSPEVGWKWNRHSGNGCGGNPVCGIENPAVQTPDSAYAADSSFASASSSNTEVDNDRRRGYSYKQRVAIDARRADQRKMLEQEIRRVEKTRADEKLKQRCAKLQEQLESAGSQKDKRTLNEANDKNTKIIPNSSSSNDIEIKSQSISSASVKFNPQEKLKNPEILTDFFNDSDMDYFLLEATQEIESKIDAQTQPAFVHFSNTSPKSSISSECTSPVANSAPAATSTPPANKTAAALENTSVNKENNDRSSSFYMKFMEDDCPDDWFLSLDEAFLQATNYKKPRTSLQRYKSMPTETATSSNTTLNRKDNNGNCIMNSKTNPSKHPMSLSDKTAASSSTLFKIKRHSSTNALSPSTNCRSRRQL